jgi:hypothetical protein
VWLGTRAKRILGAVDHPNHHDHHAWRRAAESWVCRQGLIEVSIKRQPVTPFSPQFVP